MSSRNDENLIIQAGSQVFMGFIVSWLPAPVNELDDGILNAFIGYTAMKLLNELDHQCRGLDRAYSPKSSSGPKRE